MQARIDFCCILFIVLLLVNGCTHSNHKTHWLYNTVPENKQCIRPYEVDRWLAWALLGNDDDGIFGEKVVDFQGECSVSSAIAWQMRNPLHNFCFYVIGSADKDNEEVDLLKISSKGICFWHYHPIAHTVFADNGTSFYLGLHGAKPFISLRLRYLPTRQLDFYAGWRERGNFGLKFNPFSKAK